MNEVGLNATVGHAPRRPRAPETHDEPASATGTSNLAATAPVGRVVVPKVAKASAPSAAQSGAASETSPRAGTDNMSIGGNSAVTAPAEIDWSTEPLPPQWERKLPKGTNKVHFLLLQFVLLSLYLPLFISTFFFSMCTSTMPRRRHSGTIPGTLPSNTADRRPRNLPQTHRTPLVIWGPVAEVLVVTMLFKGIFDEICSVQMLVLKKRKEFYALFRATM